MGMIMIKQTRWNGKVLRPGDPVPGDIDNETATRWLRRGIAERTTKSDPVQPATEPAPETSEPLEDLTVKELKEIASEQAIELPRSAKKKTIIDMIKSTNSRIRGEFE